MNKFIVIAFCVISILIFLIYLTLRATKRDIFMYARKFHKNDENFESSLLNIAYPIPEKSEYPDLYKKNHFLALLKSYKRLRNIMLVLISSLVILIVYLINWGFK
ncbi:hypothetical protein SAMN05444274_1333 [Mariniphaga anaerophila]|uniref:Uncharacterized protein n=1 Tax=Mariniphaga anaerophila TaxID=1484053 RepID=A0A1M5GT00_9BACT|nr:hypothetical protein SAMN05444274_1333 [Mariniphaga anaerophila]